MAITAFDTVDWSKLMEDEFLKQMHTKNNPLMSVGAVDSGAYPSHAHSHPLPNGGHTGVGGYVSGNNSSADHTHSYSATAQQAGVPARWSEQNLLSMLGSRMSWGVEGKCPFQKVTPFKAAEKVIVFVVLKDEALIIEDEAYLYPSDALITQLRILAEAL